MEIFGKHIFGNDAQEFLNLCFEDQVKWIEKNTKQRDKEQIKQLLSTLVVGKEECLDCKQKRESYGGNISETVSTAVADGNEQGGTRKDNAGDSTKRPTVKARKGKRV